MSSEQSNPAGGQGDPKQLRLTLRTLLAYLDDVLEPGPAREIGKRIEETPYASQLVERIQDVLRRRRVAAPDLTGPGSGLDPNTVAEYLDNTLPPKSVADVERVCLESDAHLAEVAACHQILTMVLGDPIHVSGECRERLHALIPAALARKPEPEQEPPAREPARAAAKSRPARELVQPSNNGGSAVAASPARFSETIPDYLKPKPFWKRALVPAFVVAILLLWVGLLMNDPSLLGQGSEEADPNQVAMAEKETNAKTGTEKIPAKKTEEAETPAEKIDTPPMPAPAEEKPAEPDNKQGSPIVIDEPAPEQKGTEKEPMETVVASNDKKAPPAETPGAKPGEPPMKVEPEPPMATKTGDTPPAPESPLVLYSTKQANSVTKGLLLRYDADKNEWGTLPQRAYVMLDERLACPEPLDAVFSVSKADCEITFIGGVLASFKAPTAPAAIALDVSQGKVIFHRKEAGEGSVIVTVHVGEDLLLLELADPNTRCAIEILPKLPNQVEQGLGEYWYEGRLWVDTGRVRLMDRSAKTHVLSAKQAIDLTPQPQPEDPPEPMPPAIEVDQLLPAWLDPAGRTFKSLTARYVLQFYTAFEEADIEADVTTVLLPLAKDDKTPPAVAVMAGRALAMTGCVRDVAHLLSLSEATPEEIRKATLDGVRRWLALNPDKEHGQALRKELGQNFHKPDADAIYRLLWGYRKEDLKDSAEANKLVDQLDDDNITIRTLAFMILQEHSGQKTNNYRPLDTKSQRQMAIERWREDVMEDGLFQ